MKTKLCMLLLMLSAYLLKADGLIIVPHPNEKNTPYPLEVRYHRVKVDIKNGIAKTNIDQEFYNPTNSRLEGIYIFPVPEGAIISGFSMDINGQEMQAELLPAEKAKGIYEDIVRRMKDPALLEYAGRDVFKVRIFPIEPRSSKKIRIQYGQMLKKDSGIVRYVYPLNTEKFSSKSIGDVSIKVNIETDEKIKMLFCSTHNVEITRKSDLQATIGFEASNVLPDMDFIVYYSTDRKDISVDLLTYKEEDEDGFFILNISPSYMMQEKEIIQKNIVFVVDTSGSMAGKKIEQAKNALDFCISNLNRKDRFDIVRFSTEAEVLFGELKTVDTKSIESAKTFIEKMRPVGGTNIEEALTMALSVLEGEDKNPASIIFITDGKPTIGLTDEDEIIRMVEQKNRKGVRIFVFGIDYEINTHLLDRIAEISSGYRDYVTPEEDIEIKITSFYEKIRYPVLSNIRIKINALNTYSTYPKKIPDLFKNSQIVITGRYKKGGSTEIILEGIVEGKKKSFEYNISFPHINPANEFIPHIWAAQHIGYLLDEVRLNGENKEVKEEIIEVATRYGIITPYTSFLIVEDEQRRESTGRTGNNASPLSSNMPASLLKSSEKEYRSMYKKSGKESVVASEEISALRTTQNYQQIYQGKDRLSYVDTSGRVHNLTSQVKNVQGRAVYQNGNIWVDSAVARTQNPRISRIQFGSPEYFDLIKKKPKAGQFLALSRNVQFILDGTLYEIYE
ncbi:MAG TPA: VIT domain-containing protein [bacterium]|nr:VIT domain-containing protein [bacterium]HPP30338.1 VIT domain-containing protein [bacterium]